MALKLQNLSSLSFLLHSPSLLHSSQVWEESQTKRGTLYASWENHNWNYTAWDYSANTTRGRDRSLQNSVETTRHFFCVRTVGLAGSCIRNVIAARYDSEQLSANKLTILRFFFCPLYSFFFFCNNSYMFICQATFTIFNGRYFWTFHSLHILPKGKRKYLKWKVTASDWSNLWNCSHLFSLEYNYSSGKHLKKKKKNYSFVRCFFLGYWWNYEVEIIKRKKNEL